jgi:type II secretory pathway component PulF
MPKLAQIYRDFGMRTPPAWNVLNRLNPLLGSALLIATALAATLIILGVLGRNARWIFFRRLEHDRPLRAISDRLLWCTPVFGSQARDRDLADVCQALADGLDHQRPFDTLLREAASPHLNEVTLGRLEEWSRLLVQGEPLSQAARGAWMPGLICGLIGNASRSSDSLAPTFAFLARHYHRRSVQRGAWLSAAVMPAVTLMCGAVVTFCALTLWVPLCAIIDATLPYQTRL